MSYVLVGYPLAVASLLGYTLWVLARGRRLSRQVPEEHRRWM